MPKRTADYDEMIAKQLQKDRKFAREFVIVRVEEEDYTIQESLAQLAKSMGQKEFAELVGISVSRVTELINEERKLKVETLQKYLKPFGLELEIGLKKVA